jgi:dimethylglycine catabolism A
LFQEVETDARSFTRYIANLVAACEAKGVKFRWRTDATAASGALATFDRIVIASGAAYRFGLGAFVNWLVDAGMTRAPLVRRLFTSTALRNWFYYQARRGTAERFRHLPRPGQQIVVIGDAARAGKSKDAIATAFEAALLGTGTKDNL